MQLAKLQDSLKQKMFDKKPTKDNASTNGISQMARITPSNDIRFTKMSVMDEFATVVQKSMEEQNQHARNEAN